MTTTEAIKQLQTEHDLIANERDLDGSQFAPALLEALAMAIEVLKCSEIPNGSDCIDRAEAQTAIQFAARRYTVAHEAHGAGKVVWSDNLISVTDAMNVLREVPSAQSEIVRCKDCGHWDTTWQNDFAPNYHYCSLVDGTRRGDFYCADAERRGEQGE